MNKPESLRAQLLAAVPRLRHSRNRLLVFIDKGKLSCTAAASLYRGYVFELKITFCDFAEYSDAVILPLLAWVRTEQSERLANLGNSAQSIGFKTDILNNSKVDLAITPPLTERVVVKHRPDGTNQPQHAAERPCTEYKQAGT